MNPAIEQGGRSIEFEQDVHRALVTVQSTLAKTLKAVGVDFGQPRSMARQLGIDKTLAWKLANIVTAEDVVSALDYLPGRSGLDIAARSLKSAGASEKSLEAMRQAIAALDRAVKVHSGDRETFAMMVGQTANGGQRERDEAHRKQAFNGNRAIWGVQARLQMSAHFVAPNVNDPSMLDLAMAGGLVDFRRLRHDTVWTVATFRQYSDDGASLLTSAPEPIDLQAKMDNTLPIIRDFCSDPLPPLRTAKGVEGRTNYQIGEGPVGNTAAITCISGAIQRGRFGLYRDEHNEYGEHVMTLTTPVECMMLDLYVHRAIPLKCEPEVAMYSQLPNDPVYPSAGRETGRMRINETVIEVGPASSAIETPEFPRHRALIDVAFARLGWSARDFHGYRFKMHYPPMSTIALFRWELPER